MRITKQISLLLALALTASILPYAWASETQVPETQAAAAQTLPAETALTEPVSTQPQQTFPPETVPTETVPEKTEAQEPVPPTPVTVAFLCQPSELTLILTQETVDGEAAVHPQEHDPFLYRLAPGTYSYSAQCDGYHSISGGSLVVSEGSEPMILRLTLEAVKPDPTHCTVSFDPCGGSCTVSSARVAIGASMRALPIPTRPGWRFAGWYLGKTYSPRFTEDSVLSQDVTVYAHWSKAANSGTALHFDAAGGTLEDALCVINAACVNADLSQDGLSVFDWSGAAISGGSNVRQAAVDDQGRITELGMNLTVPENGLVLCAVQANEPTQAMAFLDSLGVGNYVFFDRSSRLVSAYGSQDGLLARHKYIQPSKACGALPRPILEGKQFVGWFTHPQDGTRVTAETVLTGAIQRLYAHWTDECEHSFLTEIHHPTRQTPGHLLYTCTKCAQSKQVNFSYQWSDWTTQKPGSVPQALVETRTEYRCRLRDTMVSAQASQPGWTRYGTLSGWTDYGPWGQWSLTSAQRSCPVQVETTPLYRYYCYQCAACGDRSSYPGACGCQGSNILWKELWSPISYQDSAAAAHSSTRMASTALGDGLCWYFASGNLNNTALGTLEAGGDRPVIRLGFRTRTRSQAQHYQLCRWNDWSQWSAQEVLPSENIEVQTRTVYRVYTGTLPETAEEHCPTCETQPS